MVSVLYFEVLFISLIREQNLLKLSAFLFCFHEIKQVAQVDGICAGSCCCCYLPPSPSIVFPRKACIVKHDWTIFQIPSHSLWMFIQNKTVTKQHQSLPSRQHIYLLLQYDWHSCVSRTFLHGAHSPIAFLSFSLSLSVVEPSSRSARLIHAWFLLLWTGRTGRKWHPTLMNTTASPPTPRSSTARMLSLRWPGEG